MFSELTMICKHQAADFPHVTSLLFNDNKGTDFSPSLRSSVWADIT